MILNNKNYIHKALFKYGRTNSFEMDARTAIAKADVGENISDNIVLFLDTMGYLNEGIFKNPIIDRGDFKGVLKTEKQINAVFEYLLKAKFIKYFDETEKNAEIIVDPQLITLSSSLDLTEKEKEKIIKVLEETKEGADTLYASVVGGIQLIEGADHQTRMLHGVVDYSLNSNHRFVIKYGFTDSVDKDKGHFTMQDQITGKTVVDTDVSFTTRDSFDIQRFEYKFKMLESEDKENSLTFNATETILREGEFMDLFERQTSVFTGVGPEVKLGKFRFRAEQALGAKRTSAKASWDKVFADWKHIEGDTSYGFGWDVVKGENTSMQVRYSRDHYGDNFGLTATYKPYTGFTTGAGAGVNEEGVRPSIFASFDIGEFTGLKEENRRVEYVEATMDDLDREIMMKLGSRTVGQEYYEVTEGEGTYQSLIVPDPEKLPWLERSRNGVISYGPEMMDYSMMLFKNNAGVAKFYDGKLHLGLNEKQYSVAMPVKEFVGKYGIEYSPVSGYFMKVEYKGKEYTTYFGMKGNALVLLPEDVRGSEFAHLFGPEFESEYPILVEQGLSTYKNVIKYMQEWGYVPIRGEGLHEITDADFAQLTDQDFSNGTIVGVPVGLDATDEVLYKFEVTKFKGEDKVPIIMSRKALDKLKEIEKEGMVEYGLLRVDGKGTIKIDGKNLKRILLTKNGYIKGAKLSDEMDRDLVNEDGKEIYRVDVYDIEIEGEKISKGVLEFAHDSKVVSLTKYWAEKGYGFIYAEEQGKEQGTLLVTEDILADLISRKEGYIRGLLLRDEKGNDKVDKETGKKQYKLTTHDLTINGKTFDGAVYEIAKGSKAEKYLDRIEAEEFGFIYHDDLGALRVTEEILKGLISRANGYIKGEEIKKDKEGNPIYRMDIYNLKLANGTVFDRAVLEFKETSETKKYLKEIETKGFGFIYDDVYGTVKVTREMLNELIARTNGYIEGIIVKNDKGEALKEVGDVVYKLKIRTMYAFFSTASKYFNNSDGSPFLTFKYSLISKYLSALKYLLML